MSFRLKHLSVSKRVITNNSCGTAKALPSFASLYIIAKLYQPHYKPRRAGTEDSLNRSARGRWPSASLSAKQGCWAGNSLLCSKRSLDGTGLYQHSVADKIIFLPLILLISASSRMRKTSTASSGLTGLPVPKVMAAAISV